MFNITCGLVLIHIHSYYCHILYRIVNIYLFKCFVNNLIVKCNWSLGGEFCNYLASFN